MDASCYVHRSHHASSCRLACRGPASRINAGSGSVDAALVGFTPTGVPAVLFGRKALDDLCDAVHDLFASGGDGIEAALPVETDVLDVEQRLDMELEMPFL